MKRTGKDFAARSAPARLAPGRDYVRRSTSVASWLLTTDHKRVAILYGVVVTLMFFAGGAAALLVRLELLTPHMEDTAAYNRWFSAHGIIMVWFFLVPLIPTTLGNFLLPMMIGARDLAFPKLNLLSWYVFMTGAAFSIAAVLFGGVDSGWTFYTPFTTKAAQGYVVAAACGVIIAGFSSIMTGLNFVVTVHQMRAPGMTWFRLPLFVWSLYATSLIMLLATPVLAVVLTCVIAERAFGIGIFDPSMGGDPVLFQHMFWFYSHPAVYIMILPGMGVVSEVLTCFSRKHIFGYRAIVAATIGIAVIGFFVWGHHMFVAGQSYAASMFFSLLSMLVAVPSAIKVFNWTATVYRGSIDFAAPMIYALGFIALFTVGGLTGLHLASLGSDMHVHDTYFVVAHFHFVMVGGMVTAYFGGLHYWWPKVTGRLYSRWWSQAAAVVMFVGFCLTFLPQFILGYNGVPRRSPNYPIEFQVYHVLSTAGSSILGLAYLAPMVYLSYSLFHGQKAGPNPWRATGLEWQTASPPPKHNFERTPVVTAGPYEYGGPEPGGGK